MQLRILLAKCEKSSEFGYKHKIPSIMNSLPERYLVVVFFFCQYSRTWLACIPGDGSASASQGTRSLDCRPVCRISDMRGTKASVV